MMRWIRFSQNGNTYYGILNGEQIQRVQGTPFDSYKVEQIFIDLADVKIEIPVLPRTFYCAGLNYSEHVLDAAKKEGKDPNLPTRAEIGYRANNALIAHNEAVLIPKDATEKIHYEGELVVVIGKKAKNPGYLRPTSPAMMRAIFTRAAKRSGFKDCAPSERASSGWV